MVHILITGVIKVNGYAFKESSIFASLFNGSTYKDKNLFLFGANSVF